MRKRINPKHPPSYARECVSYSPETGRFVWLERPRHHFKSTGAWKRWNRRFPGNACGSQVEGRWVICLSGVKYPATHIAWALTYGRWPKCYIDHINGDQLDNRAENLREVTELENNQNAKLYKTNKTGVHGVYQDKWGNWYAQIGARGKKVTLGYFYNFEDARDARLKAQCKFGFHPNHGRVAPLSNDASAGATLPGKPVSMKAGAAW